MHRSISPLLNILLWTCRALAALIMLQTLYFKLSGAEESVYIFTKVGIEPWGRYVTALAEFIASIVLLIPAVSWLGALMGIGIMCGAIVSHLTILGINVQDDGGYLFLLACITMLACITVLWIEKQYNPFLTKFIQKIL